MTSDLPGNLTPPALGSWNPPPTDSRHRVQFHPREPLFCQHPWSRNSYIYISTPQTARSMMAREPMVSGPSMIYNHRDLNANNFSKLSGGGRILLYGVALCTRANNADSAGIRCAATVADRAQG